MKNFTKNSIIMLIGIIIIIAQVSLVIATDMAILITLLFWGVWYLFIRYIKWWDVIPVLDTNTNSSDNNTNRDTHQENINI